MVYVSKKKGESKDSLFRKFTRIFIEEKIVDDVRSRLFYKKPSTLKKEKEKLRKQRPHRITNRMIRLSPHHSMR